MSTSRALPVLRTPDLRAAHDAARRLLALAVPMDGFLVEGETTARTPAEARRLFAAFPTGRGATPWPNHPRLGYEEVRGLFDAGDPRFDGLGPLEFQAKAEPPGGFEELFLDVVGSGPGSLSWTHFFWPAVPELGLEPRAKDTHLQIAVNSRNVDFDRPSDDHTLFVHFRGGDLERARWLARQVGLEPVGPEECGW
ncbi:hypothetical protein GCM10018790_45090 [Kitasatospora xanthocidica]|uniref:hypothetical protein n=1 Tax=Kitasatospora xanthocidica TaxID=83382 RepID=UPI0016762A75|nr:hypothetical protein [Kitasatospora xanthocidica]GHF62075.1 hypothetical protein GCM10018790_45090 [Kitasatospora xanthocidica]